MPRRAAAVRVLVAGAVLGAAGAAADTMRCGTDVVSRGDTQIELIEECGQPDAIERLPALLVPGATIYGGRYYAAPFASPLVPVSVELWTYNFGPRRLMRQVRLESGAVTEIITLGYGF
jgi:hypothetical protein